ncbi:hypothetical protein [Anaeromicropila populeti]|uniref:Uncharacterized protein n=1 Tax=Anaeromicropila populeti TaxID=37658 RepID=A0A1I6JQ50_9FIRM|nr:hypothetical protein [Anaeromicropila populeti]SFR81074.1 hypothetical protein SAMN05661086_01861 [Anaeromicropila populeti]
MKLIENNQLGILGQPIRDTIRFTKLSESDKEKKCQRIMAKVKSGKRLTSNELAFLQQYYPELYIQAKKYMAEKEAFESRLKQARTKEEVNNLITYELQKCSQSAADPESKMNSVLESAKEFKQTEQYKKLPTQMKKRSNR